MSTPAILIAYLQQTADLTATRSLNSNGLLKTLNLLSFRLIATICDYAATRLAPENEPAAPN